MKVNSRCRECEGIELVRFLDLGVQPLANSFLTKSQLDQLEPKYPLEAYFCTRCHLAQLVHVVDPSEMFRHYGYLSSAMPNVRTRWRRYAEDVSRRFLNDSQDLVLEIGSNDGVLLRHFHELGHQILGVDPARNLADIAAAEGIPTVAEFFTASLASQIREERGLPKAILANNVFAHIDDHLDLLHGIEILLHPDGVFVLEAPYLLDLVEHLAYDTIYHEHLSFLSVRPLVRCFARFGLEIFDVHIVPSQGRSIRVFAGHRGRYPKQDTVQRLIDRELDLGLDRVETYLNVAVAVAAAKERLVARLTDLKRQGKRIAAYGAPAKGNTVLNYCRIGTEILDFAVDDLPTKRGLFTPGMHVPIASREEVDCSSPDYLLLLAWNYREAVMEKERRFLDRGGRFIVPVGAEDGVVQGLP